MLFVPQHRIMKKKTRPIPHLRRLDGPYGLQKCLGLEVCKVVMLVWHDKKTCDACPTRDPFTCHAKTQLVMRKAQQQYMYSRARVSSCSAALQGGIVCSQPSITTFQTQTYLHSIDLMKFQFKWLTKKNYNPIMPEEFHWFYNTKSQQWSRCTEWHMNQCGKFTAKSSWIPEKFRKRLCC